MNIKYLCPYWGSESLSPQEYISRVVDSGYDGIELSLTDPRSEDDRIVSLAKDNKLIVVTQHWDTFDRDMHIHLEKFEKRIRYAASFSPAFVNSHSGRDLFTLEENLTVFKHVLALQKEINTLVVHETHRGRCFHSSWRTKEILDELPDLKICLDMSHWCNVSESLLADQHDFIDAVIPHVHLIHSRVGHAHAPQVTDPRAPEWQNALNAHLAVWDKVVDYKRKNGDSDFYITTEFGPIPYLPTLPYTNLPVASQWDINVHMKGLLKERF